jgi:hypothetical protein
LLRDEIVVAIIGRGSIRDQQTTSGVKLIGNINITILILVPNELVVQMEFSQLCICEIAPWILLS